jgi:hypothetical protein
MKFFNDEDVMVVFETDPNKYDLPSVDLNLSPSTAKRQKTLTQSLQVSPKV